MDISKGAIHSQRVRRPCNVPTNQRHGPGQGEVIDIRRCERIAGNPCCQSLLDPGSRGKCHEYATIEVSKRTHPRNSRAFTRRWGVTARDTRTAVASTLQIPRWTVHSKRTRFESAPITLMNQTRQGTRVHARTHARGLSIFGNFLPFHSIARCLWPTPLIVVACQQSISTTRYPQPRLRILRVCVFLLLFFSRFYPLRAYSMIDPLYPIVDSMAVCATWAHELIHSVHMGPVRRDVTAQNCCLANYVFFFWISSLSDRDFVLREKCERENTVIFRIFKSWFIWLMWLIFIPIKSDWSEPESD